MGAGAPRGLQNRLRGAVEASWVGSIPIHPRHLVGCVPARYRRERMQPRKGYEALGLTRSARLNPPRKRSLTVNGTPESFMPWSIAAACPLGDTYTCTHSG